MTKNKKVMSLAIKPELHVELKKVAHRKQLSASSYLGNLVEQALKLNPDDEPMVIAKPMDEDIVPIILKIPVALKGHPDKLKQWLDIQCSGILKAMTKQKTPVVIDAEEKTQVVEGGEAIGEQG